MKDHVCFIHSAIRTAFTISNVYFVLAGRNVQSDNVKLTSLIPHNLKHRFLFMGERNDMLELMCMADIFCLSSAWGEAFPNVIGEAMSTETPCVATDVGDCKEIIGTTGVVVSARDQIMLSDAMNIIYIS